MKDLPDLTGYSREQLIELVQILHTSERNLAARFDQAIAILQSITRPVDTESRAT